MEPAHIAVGEAQIGGFLKALDPTVGFGIVVHLLNVERGQLPKLDGSNGRDNMILDHVVVVVGRAGADIGLAVGFEPQPAPLGHSVFAGVIDGQPPTIGVLRQIGRAS